MLHILKQVIVGLVTPFRNHNFAWVFVSRLFYGLGNMTVQEFLQYYFGDVLSGPYELGPLSLDGPEVRMRIMDRYTYIHIDR